VCWSLAEPLLQAASERHRARRAARGEKEVDPSGNGPKGDPVSDNRYAEECDPLEHPLVGSSCWNLFQERPSDQIQELKPHLVKTFKVSNDPRFVEKVSDIIGLYLNPPDIATLFALSAFAYGQGVSSPVSGGRIVSEHIQQLRNALR
jgi:hypothetical protein